MSFKFRVKKKDISREIGVVVIGKVLSGTIFASNEVIVTVGCNEYHAHLERIVDRPGGNIVESISHGNNVVLFLSGIDAELIKPRITIVRNVANTILHASSRNGSNPQPDNFPPCNLKDLHDSHSRKSREKLSFNNNSNNVEYTVSEKDYIKDIMMCIIDKERLTPTELYVLDKLRIAYGITEKRSRELVSSTLTKYNKKKNEMLYRDAVAACLLDCGYLTSTERYLLERLRISLNISEHESYIIEKDCDWDV